MSQIATVYNELSLIILCPKKTSKQTLQNKNSNKKNKKKKLRLNILRIISHKSWRLSTKTLLATAQVHFVTDQNITHYKMVLFAFRYKRVLNAFITKWSFLFVTKRSFLTSLQNGPFYQNTY